MGEIDVTRSRMRGGDVVLEGLRAFSRSWRGRDFFVIGVGVIVCPLT